MKLQNRLHRLEAEALFIIREVVATMDKTVMLYSIGKDSTVLLHLGMKAFSPGPLPFPLLHIDTTWKFREMIEFRDKIVKKFGLDLIVHINQEGIKTGIDPFISGSRLYTDLMKTAALRQALDKFGFDAAFGGARRDEEKSRSKERILSLRSAEHRWEPKNQRPEPWNLFNTRKKPGESFRVFPLSNWTENDIWDYIAFEQLSVVPLYFAKKRPVVRRDGMLIMRDDARMKLKAGEEVEELEVRFRTLGCYPFTGAVLSNASNLSAIRKEMQKSRTSERKGRLIDKDGNTSMEEKKQEGYF
ncbi:MAG: sulfate adenylyltransferase subunit 2 [Candidatus Tokpelaia sp. JSC085]|nr:MAG: sulfate adenylyltransferase subunit 2 [Candidatus Tokpelaia sp. JSC085]